MALVELPTASRLVRILAPSPSTSPDISAMPWALSDTGPKVSMDTITPTVVSRPVPARATANNDRITEPPPASAATYTAAPINRAEYTADSRPSEMPDRMTVAGPVSDVLATSSTGRRSVSVKYAVNCWMTTARMMPDEDRPDREDPRVEGVDGDDIEVCDLDAGHVDQAVGQEHERRDDHQDRRDGGRGEEPTVDGLHTRTVGGPRRHDEDADHGGDDADGGNHEREHETQVAESGLARMRAATRVTA